MTSCSYMWVWWQHNQCTHILSHSLSLPAVVSDLLQIWGDQRKLLYKDWISSFDAFISQRFIVKSSTMVSHSSRHFCQLVKHVISPPSTQAQSVVCVTRPVFKTLLRYFQHFGNFGQKLGWGELSLQPASSSPGYCDPNKSMPQRRSDEESKNQRVTEWNRQQGRQIFRKKGKSYVNQPLSFSLAFTIHPLAIKVLWPCCGTQS